MVDTLAVRRRLLKAVGRSYRNNEHKRWLLGDEPLSHEEKLAYSD